MKEIDRSQVDVKHFNINGSILQVKINDFVCCFLHDFTSEFMKKLTKETLKEYIIENKDKLNIRIRKFFNNFDIQEGEILKIK